MTRHVTSPASSCTRAFSGLFEPAAPHLFYLSFTRKSLALEPGHRTLDGKLTPLMSLQQNYSATSPLRRRRKHGFTLVEIMVAVMVLAFGVSASVVALRVGFGMVETARDQTMVSQFLQSEIENLRMMRWAEISALPEEETFSIESDFDDFVADRFTCVRRVEDVRPGARIKRVTLTVTWRTTNGVERELVYKTRISSHGLSDYFYRSP